MMNIFGIREPKPDASQLAKEWKRKLQKECREIDRNITNLRREEMKAINECKRLAKSGHLQATKILAKQIAATRKAAERMYIAKAEMNSVSMQLQATASMVKLKENVAKSTTIMATMNGLINIPEVSKTMREMAREMERAGLIEEIVDETMASMEPEGLETEADAEVEKILHEITSDVFAKAAEAPTERVAKASSAAPVETPVVEEAQPAAEDEDFRAMQARLQAL